MNEIGNAGKGYRGYITSRPVRGQEPPHQVQNMVVREYCRRNDLLFLLSATEYSVPNCYMMLTELFNGLASCQGLVLYSQFLLPPTRSKRLALYDLIIAAGSELHAALENTAIKSSADVTAFEDTIGIVNGLPQAPMTGQYNKSGETEDLDAFKALVL